MDTDLQRAAPYRGTSSQTKIPTFMNGLLLEEYNKPYAYRDDIPVPLLEPGMLLIRVKVAGFCHTDLMVSSGDYPALLPMVPGHETVGVVVAVAEGVTDFEVGDRVGTLLFRGGCGRCRECLRGTPEYCSQIQLAGLNSHGGMAQYLLADPAWTVHLPDTMKFLQAAPLMCAGATVYHSLLRCGVPTAHAEDGKGGGLVGVVGIGGLGHLAVQFAKAMGYNVVAIDNRRAPLELCTDLPKHLQPDLLLNTNETTMQGMLRAIMTTFEEAIYTPGSELRGVASPPRVLPTTGLDAVLVCTDAIQAFATGSELLAKHGTLVYVGQPKEPVPFHWSTFVTRDITVVAGCLPCGRWSGARLGEELDLRGTGVQKCGRWMNARDVTREMMELVERAGLHVEVSCYGLRDIGKLKSEFRGDSMKGKVVLRIEDD